MVHGFGARRTSRILLKGRSNVPSNVKQEDTDTGDWNALEAQFIVNVWKKENSVSPLRLMTKNAKNSM